MSTTGNTYTAGNCQVDHVVSLREAWKSGAHAWTPEQRSTLLLDSRNLAPTASCVNRSKGAREVGEWDRVKSGACSGWMLTQAGFCYWIRTTIAVKAEYGLRIKDAGCDPAGLHRKMMEEVLTGCDVMPAAVHLTAAVLSGERPDIGYNHTKTWVMPFEVKNLGNGEQTYIGSLDLLCSDQRRALFDDDSTTVEAKGMSAASEAAVPDGHFDLVVMNPPFTRPTNAAARDETGATPKTANGAIEAIRTLYVDYNSAVKVRTRTVDQLEAVVVTAPGVLRHKLDNKSTSALVKTCAGLVLLSKKINASYGDLPYEEKLPYYYKENLLAGSLHPKTYERNPGFLRFVQESGLPFRPHEEFKRKDMEERGELYRQLAERIWNPDNLRCSASC